MVNNFFVLQGGESRHSYRNDDFDNAARRGSVRYNDVSLGRPVMDGKDMQEHTESFDLPYGSLSGLGLSYAIAGASPPFQPYINVKGRDYDERQVNWVASGFKNSALFYQFHVSADEDGHQVNILPDACPNILFECNPDDPRAIVSGVFLEPRELQLKQGIEYFGFKPYSTLYIHSKTMDFTEIINGSIDFLDAFPEGGRLIQELVNTRELDARIGLFNAFAKQHMISAGPQPDFVDYFSLLLCRSGGNARLGDVSRKIGYSERYCRKRFKDAFGYSPKQYSSIMRFQSALKGLANTRDDDYSSVIFDNGFFDQAHFIHDFTRYTHLTPGRFVKETHTSAP
jgi:AraC-like DNA-binding protein